MTARVVRLPTSAIFAPALDGLAEAFAADPEAVGRLLRQHAARALTLDLLVVDDSAEQWQRDMAATEADGTRAALVRVTGCADALDLVMSPDAADLLAADLTRVAADVRRSTDSKDER